ncbi:chloride channel protein [Lacihabitans lacunae]|uniref:Chloride channel protein n=1 Tax=Lacihabitans lacunae TaxID=1028214 RepID=A0ABV7YT10_9BACT
MLDLYIKNLTFLFKWILITSVIGVLAGSGSALFLFSLEWCTNYRLNNPYVLYFLPLSGLLIGLWYHFLGTNVAAGNNLIIDEYHKPKEIISIKMAPMVLITTLMTHIVGGSAGREGTAIQMSASLSDQLSRMFKIDSFDRKLILLAAISGGFASVFGTPLAGALFALEVALIGKISYKGIMVSFFAAYFSNFVCDAWGIHHTQYLVSEVPYFDLKYFPWVILAGIIFGITALSFSKATYIFANTFKKYINYPPFRPLVGGFVLLFFFLLFDLDKFQGLGVPFIEASFKNIETPQVFVLKLLFTAFTLSAGFKGGEVTPLFFIGATLGSALAVFMPLPVSLLAGMGFVAVFSGATNTPLACTFMAIELFGAAGGLYYGIACVVGYIFSGHSSIYSSQLIGEAKHPFFDFLKYKSLKNL